MFKHTAYLNELNTQLTGTYNVDLVQVLDVIKLASSQNKRIFVAGNGGNSANAEHFVTDITKGLFESTGSALKATSLNSNSARLSAIANDLPREQGFAFQLRMLEAEEGSIVILYSAGGNSTNIFEAAKTANDLGAITVGLIGGTAPTLIDSFDYRLWTKSNDIQIVEDVHAVFGHLVYKNFIGSP